MATVNGKRVRANQAKLMEGKLDRDQEGYLENLTAIYQFRGDKEIYKPKEDKPPSPHELLQARRRHGSGNERL